MEQRVGGMPEGLPVGGQSTDGKLNDSARLQILATEHWSLLATRSLSWSESFSRTSMFLSTLTGAVVALALVAQAMPGQGFVLFALLLLPVVFFLGVATFARLVSINREDAVWVIGMNRLRHAYMEMAPDLEQYFISGVYDDIEGVMQTFAARTGPGQFMHHFVTTPGMVAVVDGVIGGVLAAVVAGVVGIGTVGSVIVGAVAFVATIGALLQFQHRSQVNQASSQVPKFPRPTSH
jgi:hypothetical protein